MRGGEIRSGDDARCLAAGERADAVYRSASGRLRFEAVATDCRSRRTVLAGQVWLKERPG